MNRKILAFYSPYPGAGKSTAAEYLAEALGPFWHVHSFAKPLRGIADYVSCCAGVNRERNTNKGESLKTFGGASYRDLLIAFGRAGREVYPDMWVKCLKYMVECCTCKKGVIIDDLRFPNEYAMLREEGAKIVRLANPGRKIVRSETEALLEGNEYNFDAYIVNDKQDIEHYHALLDAMITTLWPDMRL